MTKVIPSVKNPIVDNFGNRYNSLRELARVLGVSRGWITGLMKKNGSFTYSGKVYTFLNNRTEEDDAPVGTVPAPGTFDPDYEDFLKSKDVNALPFKIYKFDGKAVEKGHRYAVALFSDLHIEETVTLESTNYLNEYNVDIAEARVKTYFKNLANVLAKDEVDDLYFACLGDLISGYIHDELAQENSLTPLEATYKAQSLVYSGLKYLCEDPRLKKLKNITFIGIVGNHSRTTKRIQHANGFKLSYEWLMYRNIKKECELTNLPIKFILPESEIAVIETCDNKKFIFAHGFQIKGGNGTVCGIYPALNRFCLKYGTIFKQDKVFIGHFHSSVNTPKAIINGSIISYNAFALTNGFEYERPQQQYICYDTSIGGELLTRQIYCD